MAQKTQLLTDKQKLIWKYIETFYYQETRILVTVKLKLEMYFPTE